MSVVQGVTKGRKTSSSRPKVTAVARIVFSTKAPVRSQAVLRSESRSSGQRFEVRVVRIDFSPSILE